VLICRSVELERLENCQRDGDTPLISSPFSVPHHYGFRSFGVFRTTSTSLRVRTTPFGSAIPVIPRKNTGGIEVIGGAGFVFIISLPFLCVQSVTPPLFRTTALPKHISCVWKGWGHSLKLLFWKKFYFSEHVAGAEDNSAKRISPPKSYQISLLTFWSSGSRESQAIRDCPRIRPKSFVE